MQSKLLHALSLLALFLTPCKPSLLAALGLVFADLLLGVLAAHKRGERIVSKALRRTVAKLVCYESAIILAFICEQYLAVGLPLAHIVGGFIGTTELTSCYENLQDITGVEVKTVIDKVHAVEEDDNGSKT